MAFATASRSTVKPGEGTTRALPPTRCTALTKAWKEYCEYTALRPEASSMLATIPNMLSEPAAATTQSAGTSR